MHHHHHHDHSTVRYDRAFLIGIVLNLGFVMAQATFGWLTNSLALLADAGHNLGDVLGLAIAWGAYTLARRRPTKRHTYGLRRASILSPLINSSLLLSVTVFIAIEAIQRLIDPKPVESLTVIIVAAIGILVNGATALMFQKDHQHDVNVKGAFLHMVADALVSVGVVLSGLLITLTGWQSIDAIASMGIAIVIGIGAWNLLQESLSLALDGVPANVDLRAIQNYLLDLPGVGSIHDLHVWALSSTEPALTAHLVMLAGVPGSDFLARISHDLHDRFGIEHSTIQIETGSAFLPCMQSDCGM